MIIIPFFILICLICYGMGIYVGRLFAEDEIQKKRDEMQIEEDPYDELFKQ